MHRAAFVIHEGYGIKIENNKLNSKDNESDSKDNESDSEDNESNLKR